MMGGRIQRAFPLTPLQEAMVYHTLREPESALYHGQAEAVLRGPLDENLFRRAWALCAERHEVFRTAFAWERRERPLQVVLDAVSLDLRFLDWTDLEPRTRRERWAAVLEQDRQRTFDLGQAPLMRILVVREGAERHRFLWGVHHALMDGWSALSVLREVLEDYDALVAGQAVRRPPAPSFAQFVGWLEAQDAEAARAHWRSALSGIDRATPLPYRSPDPLTSVRASTSLELTSQQTEAAGLAASRARVTLNTLVVGAWARVLGRRAASRDVLFGITASERPAAIPNVAAAAGLYLTTLPVRIRLPEDIPVGAWLAGVQKEVSEGRAHGSPGLAEIQRSSAVRNGPLLNSLVVFEGFPDEVSERFRGRALEAVEISMSSPSDLPLALLAHPGERLRLELYHDPGSLKRPDAEGLLREVAADMDALRGDPGRLLRELDAGGAGAPSRGSRAGEPLDPEVVDVLALFESRVRERPHATALKGPGGGVSYERLNQLADEVARRLLSAGGRPESMVGVLAGRSAEAIIGILGVLKAGCAYVPLDPGHPEARLRAMAAHADLLVTVEDHLHLLSPGRDAVLIPGPGSDLPEATPLATADPIPSDRAAYAIFTSGSTGEPKAVVVERRQLAWSTAARLRYYHDHPGSFLLLSPMTVDSATAGIYWTLCSGGMLVLPGDRAEQDLEGLAGLMAREAVTHTLLVPSLYQAILEDADLTRLRALRVVVVAGEACPAQVVRMHRSALPGVALFNEYGPSEASVWATVDELSVRPDGPVTIGRPVPGARVYLLDDAGREVEVGVPGEICIVGPGVARGYLRDPELTGRRFVEDPWEPGGRMYRTGDMGRWLGDGRLEFIGRRDDQIKVRGHRVEVGEVEAALATHPAVREAVVRLVDPDASRTPAPAPGALVESLRRLSAQEAESMLRKVEAMGD